MMNLKNVDKLDLQESKKLLDTLFLIFLLRKAFSGDVVLELFYWMHSHGKQSISKRIEWTITW